MLAYTHSVSVVSACRDEYSPEMCDGKCDICAPTVERVRRDVTEEVGALLKAFQQMGKKDRLTLLQLVDLWKVCTGHREIDR